MEEIRKNHIRNKPYKARRCIILILCIVLLAPVITAQMNYDNVKHFDKDAGNYGKVIIKDWFGLLDLTELELKSNTNFCGSKCSAETEIVMHQKGVLIDHIKFLIEKDGDWKKGSVENYEFYVNGKPYELGDKVDPGTYNVTLKGKKNPFQTIDWQITSQGQLIDDWAVWGGTLNTDIVAYYKFDEGTGNLTEDSVHGLYNGTLVDFGEADWVAGKIGTNSVSFDGTNNYINLSVLPDAWENISFSFWFKTDDITVNNDYFLDMRNSSGALPHVFFYGGETHKIAFYGGTNIVSDAGSLDDDSWHHVVGTLNDTGGVSIYIDGEINKSDVGGYSGFKTNLVILGNTNPVGDGLWYDGEIDEMGIWNKTLTASEVSDLWNEGNGISYQAFSVSLDSPADNDVRSTNEIEFNCSVSGASSLVNMSFYHNETGTWLLNQTVDITGSSNSSNFTTTISSSAIWNCKACDSTGCTFASSNYTIISDSESPAINITYPILNIPYGKEGRIIYLNWTASDNRAFDTCIYNYNGTNVTISSCSDLNITFTINASANNITLFANDTAGNLASSNSTWGYKIFENSQTFNSETTEGAKEEFILNLTKASSVQVSTINLIYNGTSNSFGYSTSGNEVIAQDDIIIPSKTVDVNVSFFWNINLNDGTEINTSLNNQTIFNLNVDNCTSYSKLLYNFTQYEEANQSKLLGNTMEVQMNLYDTSKSSVLINFSQKFVNSNPAQICLEDSILKSVNYSAYVIVKYYANLTTSNNSYSTEYYNILNETIGNGTIPLDKKLYDLKEQDATKFRLTFRDSYFTLAPDILVQVHRQYLEDNDFKIVEIPLTDSSGQTILNLVRNNVIYNFVMIDESGTAIATFNSQTAFCQDYTIGDCTINLNAASGGEEAYNYDENFSISVTSPTYSNATKLVSIDFITDNSLPKTIRMNVFRNNDFGNRSICTNSLTASAGTLTCDVSEVSDSDQFLFIHLIVDDEPFTQYTITLNSESIRFGASNGAFYAFLLILFLVCLFMEDKKILLVALGLGWVVVISLGLVRGAFIGSASAGVWLLVTIGIFFWKINKEEG